MISPQNLGDDVLELLGSTQLQHLHIHQNVYTPDYVMNYTTVRAWKNCKRDNPYLQVHLEMENLKEKRLLLWPAAPVTSIIYDSPHIGVGSFMITNRAQFLMLNIIGTIG